MTSEDGEQTRFLVSGGKVTASHTGVRAQSKMTAGGQITVVSRIRDFLGLEHGDYVIMECVVVDGSRKILVTPADIVPREPVVEEE